jgi:hypothetical protein
VNLEILSNQVIWNQKLGPLFPFSFEFFTRLAAVFACYLSKCNQPLERNQSSKRAGHEETGFLLGRKP